VNPACYRFGPFELDCAQQLLFRDGEQLPLEPKLLETLLSLNIHHLRKALGKDSAGREYIETVPKRGYRFVAPVTPSERDEAPHSPAARRNYWRPVLAASLLSLLGLWLAWRNGHVPPPPQMRQVTHHSSENPVMAVAI
jgi:DNA-binding winged helix-turn-helix (wHTH) protein